MLCKYIFTYLQIHNGDCSGMPGNGLKILNSGTMTQVNLIRRNIAKF